MCDWICKKWSYMHIKQPNDFHWCYYHLHMSHKAAKSTAKFINQSCGDSQSAAVCLPRVDGAIERPPEHSWMPDRLEKKVWVKADCSTFSSIKHMCCWCIDVANRWRWKVYLETVCIRPFLANLVTFVLDNLLAIFLN